MTATFVAAKLHGITVTAASVEYNGSVTIDRSLMALAGMEPYEQVDIVNLNTGGRWTTYILPGEEGVFSLNGGGARLGVVGDRCVAMTYRSFDRFPGAQVLFLNTGNQVVSVMPYPGAE
jgi:aspartate 1-decarboxylase